MPAGGLQKNGLGSCWRSPWLESEKLLLGEIGDYVCGRRIVPTEPVCVYLHGHLLAPETTGQVDFTTVAADCNRDKKDKGENHQASGNAQGKKDKGDKSGRPDSPGNSGNAPGNSK